MTNSPPKLTLKRYRCSKCGHLRTATTNHYGNTWSWGRVNTCPQCPPHAKYPEFGGSTLWECIEPIPDGAWVPETWTDSQRETIHKEHPPKVGTP